MKDPRRQRHQHLYLIATLGPTLLVLTLLAFLFTRFHDEARFYEHQAEGVEHIEQLLGLIERMQRWRGMDQLNGSAALPWELRAEQLAADIDELAAKPLSEHYMNRQSLLTVRNRILRLQESESAGDDAALLERFGEQSGLIDQMQEAVMLSASHSNLILDQEMEIYYLVDLLSNKLPSLAESLARVRGLGGGWFSTPWAESHRTRFAEQLGLVRQPLLELERIHRIVLRNNTLRYTAELPERMRVLEVGLGRYITLAEHEITRPSPSVEAEQFFNRGSELIVMINELSALVGHDLRRLLRLRSERLGALRMGLMLFALLAMSLSSYSVWRFYLNNRRTITELHAVQRLYRVLSEVNALVLRKPERDELLRRVAEIVVEEGGLRMGWMGELDEQRRTIRPLHAAGYVDGYMDGLHTALNDGSPVATSILSGEPVICNDIEHDPRMKPWRREALKRGYRSMGAFPFAQDGRVVGALTVYAVQSHYFSDELNGLLRGLGGDISHALEVLEREHQLQRAMRQLSLHLRQSPLGVVTWDRDFNILDWNPAAEQIFGYGRGQVIGRSWRLLFPESVHREFERTMLPLLGEGEAEYLLLGNVTADGRKIDCEWYTSSICDDDGEVVEVMSLLHDVTESREAQEQVLRLNRELERRVGERTAELQLANRELEAFSYSVSHDLRAPLRSLDGFSHLLLAKYADLIDETGRDYLERIRRASQKMGTIIDDLLSLSRVSRYELQRGHTDISALARQVLGELEEAEPERGVEWRVADGLACEADPKMLKIALDNLIGNAWKYTARSDRQRIEVGGCEIEGRPAFYVRDSGAGFDMRYADKLFGAFQRLHGEEEFEGSGIGLATVKRIIDRHGGLIRAEGTVGEGATFYFTC